MLRKASLVIFPMLILSTLLLTYQWSMYVYGDQTTRTSSDTPEVQIQLTHSNDSISVTQTMKNLKEGTYPFVIPSNADKVQCENEEGKPCLIQNQEVTISKNQQIRWQYQLSSNKDDKVYSDWYIQLQRNNKAIETSMNVEVIEKNDPFLKWMAPAKLHADIQKEYIHYYRWSSDSSSSFPLLHMALNSYEMFKEDDLYIYAKGSLGKKYQKLINAWKELPLEGPFIIIVNNDLQETIGKEHMILSEVDEEAISMYWLSQSLQSNYYVKQDWLISMLTHYFYDIPIQDEKSEKMIKDLSKQLSVSQKQQFLQEINEAESNQLPVELDQDLQRIIGKPTTYFKQNKHKNDPYVPLYFIENKSLKVGGEEADITWQPIVYQRERYYPLAGIASLFEFELVALPSESLYILRKDGESWRFSLNKKTFVHNEENFGVVSDVLIEIQREVFIKEKYIEELLGIKADEGSYSINLTY
ncbi:hypothetical protein [Pontibacillus sp. HMF3514]|uniref:hypothetical protein n=1 Tax=Pontibacillus sp. HMF3514 TaxID=2692425 RepID=UPI00131F8DC3|nr:hypothetical protein [Pontibacillus sp. HMF3514]QHE52076.1 hypothetical protein GS400_08575 [Pontibacillus sp. HMF3514]